VHGAALALAQAVVTAINLFHHAHYVAALGYAMAVAAVRTDDVVRVAKEFAHAHRHGFLTGVEVSEAGNFARLNFNV